MNMIFGFGEENEFSSDEFHYFLDCLFRGILKLGLPKGHKAPLYPGYKINCNEIE